MVKDLIDQDSRTRKEDILGQLFTDEQTKIISFIRLSDIVQPYTIIWQGDKTCEYTTKGGYKCALQTHLTQ